MKKSAEHISELASLIAHMAPGVGAAWLKGMSVGTVEESGGALLIQFQLKRIQNIKNFESEFH